MIKNCAICNGTGKLQADDNIITCESCNGTGSGLVHLANAFNKQINNTINLHSQTLNEIRLKSFEALSKLKKQDKQD